jgi:DNA polymerase III subunit alpha
LGAIVPRTILKKGEEAGEAEFKWWLDLFGDDYYIELQRHGIGDQHKVNEVLARFAQKFNVPMIASNDSHYTEREDFNAHDILLCINTGEKQATPTNKDFDDENPAPKGTRFAFFNDQFYFKTKDEMAKLFHDIPEAVDNTLMIYDKVEHLKLKQDIMLPNYQIPPEFATQDDYLEHITYMGAKNRYKEITPDVDERLRFELFTIKTMGFAGYFLIVSDFIQAGRDLGVMIGPGRGSAAGSAVAYCIGITNIDPIKYNLLFERFLNPDRKSMPDIDTDFDDEGRQKVIDYVVQKYGRSQVAQIVTYGTMAAKMSIKDVARVMDLPLADANALAKLVPDKPGITLNRVMKAPLTGEKSLAEKEGLSSEDLDNAKILRGYLDGKDLQASVLREALVLEGSVRGTGIHAAGIIIAPKDLTEIVPVCIAKDSDLYVTQYEGKVIEDAGVIKMDFLGLKTLTIIRDALKLIKQNHGIEIIPDDVPLDDVKTYELYQRGDTNGTFQFESPGMQKYLRELRPDKFEDLIAMNALYRPGPLEYIPNFIARKHGREKTTYDLPEMEEYLAETFGICVYQEQIMLLSQKLGGFSKGDADVLRKAMGKKDKATLDKMKPKFMEGAATKGLDTTPLEKVWTDWEAFASYAFNKSHSTCYAFVAFQTAYFKAHYPAEYMASVMTHNLSQIEKITFFMEECRRMGLKVLGPDVNESFYDFSVNKKGEIRFGLGAVKGVGEGPVEELVRARNEGGEFTDIFDMVQRVNLSACSKRVFECMAISGALDGLDGIPNRATYFKVLEEKGSPTVLEVLMRWGNAVQKSNSSTTDSLFSDTETTKDMIPAPNFQPVEEWGLMEKLNKEKEIVGIFLSGHPLDDYRLEVNKLATPIDRAKNLRDRDITIAGIVTGAQHRISKKGTGFGIVTLEDYSDNIELSFFGENYLKYEHFIRQNEILLVKGKFQPKWNAPDDFEFKISQIQQLDSVKTTTSYSSVTVGINIELLTDRLIEDLDKIANNYRGLQKLRMTLTHPDQPGWTLPLQAKERKVKVCNELIMDLERLGVEFELG